MLDRGGINSLIRLIHTIVNEKFLHFSRGSGGTGTPPVPPETMKNHPLDPDAGPHTGTLPEDEVVFEGAGHPHSGGAGGKKVTAADVVNVPAGGIAATDVQGALDELDGEKTGVPIAESDVTFDDAAGHDHQGAGNTGKKVDYTDLANKEHGPSHEDGGGDPVDVKDLPDGEGRLLTGGQKTDLTDGGTTVLHQHAGAITSGVQITLTNETGGERSAGDVVVTDPDNDESFIGTSGSPGYQGKVLVVAETIASSGSGGCWERGGPFNINVVGAVDRNDGLRTSASIYKAEVAPSVVSDGVFAIALSTSGSGGGTIKAVFLDVISEGGDGGGDGGAPTDAKYVVTEPDDELSAEVVLPQLAQYLPETPPASPGTYDDEFDLTTIDGKWSRISLNLGAADILAAPAVGVYDLSTQPGTMLIQPGPDSTWSTIYQTGVSLPTNCRIVAKIYPAAVWGGAHRGTCGIGMNDNSGTSPAGGGAGGNDGLELGIVAADFSPGGAAQDAFIIRTVETVNGAGTEFIHTRISAASGVYLMIMKTGTTYRAFWSMNGRSWVLVDSHASAETFTYLVIGAYRATASPSPIIGVDFFRYFADNAFNIGG